MPFETPRSGRTLQSNMRSSRSSPSSPQQYSPGRGMPMQSRDIQNAIRAMYAQRGGN